MILVVDAGARRVCASFSNSTVPVRASTRMADFAPTLGGWPLGAGSASSGPAPSSKGSFWARTRGAFRAKRQVTERSSLSVVAKLPPLRVLLKRFLQQRKLGQILEAEMLQKLIR